MTTDLVPTAPGQLAPLDLEQTKAQMRLYQEGVRSLLDASDWQQFVNRKGEKETFVKKSGWLKISTWFSLSVTATPAEIDRDPDGKPLRARVIARATAPNGRFAEGDGACSHDERSFSKPEHDIPATATTRAKNRAISNLVGMGEVSAEEVEGGTPATAAASAVATIQQIEQAAQAVRTLLPGTDADEFLELLRKSLQVDALPADACKALYGLGWWAGHDDTGGQPEQPQAATGEPTAPATAAQPVVEPDIVEPAAAAAVAEAELERMVDATVEPEPTLEGDVATMTNPTAR